MAHAGGNERDAEARRVRERKGGRRWITGASAGILQSMSAAIGVLVINFSLYMYAVHAYPVKDQIGTIYEGSCDVVKTATVVAHLAINCLSTVLLAASNYCAQVVSAPLRENVDKAHSERRWLDIGVPSWRNLKDISWFKRLVFFGLLMSSAPLHLIYNSTIFTTLGLNSYKVYGINPSTLHNSVWANETVHFDWPQMTNDVCKNATILGEGDCHDPWQPATGTPAAKDDPFLAQLVHMADKKKLVRLTEQRCKEIYADDLQSEYRSVLLVSNDVKDGPIGLRFNETVAPRDGDDNLSWMCGPVDRENARDCATYMRYTLHDPKRPWRPFGLAVDYCLAEKMSATCNLQFGTIPLIVVMVMNIAKFCLMLLVLKSITQSPLLNIGDAVSSFMSREDEYTKGMCLASKEYIDVTLQSEYFQAIPYQHKRQRFTIATSGQRLALCIFFIVLMLVWFLLLIFNTFYDNLSIPMGELFRIGFGAIDTRIINKKFFKSNAGLVANSLAVNAPQPILSFLYLNYNVVITGFSMGWEWDRFIKGPQTLRVTSQPRGSQRIARHISLPFMFAFAQNFFSAILHWLVSQSYFPVNLALYAAIDGENGKLRLVRNITTSGFSMPAVFTCSIVVIASLILLWVLCRLRYNGAIPVVGSCSLAMSAACHPDRTHESDGSFDGEDMATKPLQWGATKNPVHTVGEREDNSTATKTPADVVMPRGSESEGDGEVESAPQDVGHCSLTSEAVLKPEVGKLYQGDSYSMKGGLRHRRK